MDVLVGELDRPGARGVVVAESREPGADRLEVVGAEKSLRRQHLGVGDRGADVVRHQALVEPVVFAGRVGKDAFVERSSLVPEATHEALRVATAVGTRRAASCRATAS